MVSNRPESLNSIEIPVWFSQKEDSGNLDEIYSSGKCSNDRGLRWEHGQELWTSRIES